MIAGLPMRALPEAVVELAYRLFPHDQLNAISRMVDGLSDHDLRMLATIALRDGDQAAERFYRSRPRGFRRIGRVSLR
jgi:hypothetical protein